MTVISSQVEAAVQSILDTTWDIRDGQIVPSTETVRLSDGAVKINATYLYADLADSSKAAQTFYKQVTAKIIRSYVNAAVRIIRQKGGEIRSFDGDRVMAVFIGESKNTSAVRAALGINWAVHEVLRPKFDAKWPTLKDDYLLKHGVGVDTGEALIVRAGVRNNNDLVSIGGAPNVAAKLSDLRANANIYITKAVYDGMDGQNKTASDGKSMWAHYGSVNVGGKNYVVKSSTWSWKP